MVNVMVNGIPVAMPEGSTILEATKQAGFPVPTLCFLKDINEIGACRVCVVELEGADHLITACNNKCIEGMKIHTNSQKVREARRTNIELLLSQHRINCPACNRDKTCQLKKVANSINMDDTMNFRHVYPADNWDNTFPLIRNESKCIKCMRCVSVCEKVQTLGIWDMVGTGAHTTVGVSGGRTIQEADCALCGQCITHCPVNALRSRDDTKAIFGLGGALNDPNKIVVVQVAPAVRAAWGEVFDLPSEVATEKRLVTALKRIGVDYVFDTNFSADLTIMEEGTEFLQRMQDGTQHKWPMFTSCCPGWVRFLKSQYPDMVGELSTAKSPQQMFGAVTKTYFAKKIGVDPENIVCVSVMPCVAKKAEVDIPNINDAGAGKDVDYSITTREICRMISADQVDVAALPETDFDSPLGTGTGAAVIFGVTGGVMEAALRTVSSILMGDENAPLEFHDVRGFEDVKEATYELPGKTVRVAVVSGTKNAGALLDAIRKGEKEYDFVEVMCCPGGCINGGGQPYVPANVKNFVDYRSLRAKALYDEDAGKTLRKSHHNPIVQEVYANYLGAWGGEKAHHILHTKYYAQPKYRI